ncbi:MAG TPA: hypothetical protein VKT28_14480, partial [Puia sp.]|nr:hypothetical protein [Puia sp.]
MNYHKRGLLFASIVFFSLSAYTQAVTRNIKTEQYRKLQSTLASGWNTWYNNSFISYAKLPEAFAINLCLTAPGQTDFLRETFKTAAIQNRPEVITPGIRSEDGTYTSVIVKYKEDSLSIESASDGNDELILITPLNKTKKILVAEAGLLWNREGTIGGQHQQLFGIFRNDSINVHSTVASIENAYIVSTSPRLCYSLENEFCIYTGKHRTFEEIKSFINNRRKIQLERIKSFGELSPSFQAMQTILAWNTIYDAPNHRVITPVSRNWSYGWGGFVLFDWDTYFASYMLSLFNKDLAYANAIEITKSITPDGFIPNYQSTFGNTSWDRSQPPIGSSVIWWIYNKYKEKWFLEEVYDEL